mgnify:CR=1 FL=1
MTTDEEFDKFLKQFHKLSDRHILVAETDMSCSDIQKVVKLLTESERPVMNLLVL